MDNVIRINFNTRKKESTYPLAKREVEAINARLERIYSIIDACDKEQDLTIIETLQAEGVSLLEVLDQDKNVKTYFEGKAKAS